MSILPLLLLLSAPHGASAAGVASAEVSEDAWGAGAQGELMTQREGVKAAWQECLFDRADALAGYARIAPERAAELALAGCEEKARVFRRLVAETVADADGPRFLAEVEAAMKRYVLLVARASAAVPMGPA